MRSHVTDSKSRYLPYDQLTSTKWVCQPDLARDLARDKSLGIGK